MIRSYVKQESEMIAYRRIKNVLRIVTLVMGLFLTGAVLTACGEDNNRNEAPVYFDIWGSYNHDGMLNVKEGFSYFTDLQSGESVCVCSRPECGHDSGECDGYVSIDAQFLFMNDTNEFFLYRNRADDSYSLNDLIMVKADRDGRNRKTLAVLEDAQNGIDAAYDNGWLALCYLKQFDFDESSGRAGATPDLEKYKAGLYLVNTETGEIIPADEEEGYDAMFCKAAIKDGKVYYLKWYCDQKIDFDSGYDEGLRQQALYMHKSLCSYDIKTGKKKEIWTGSNESVKTMGSYFIIISEDGIIYLDGEEEMELKNREELDKYFDGGWSTQMYFTEECALFSYMENIYHYDMETGKISVLADGKLDNAGITGIDAVVGDMIYIYMKTENEGISVSNLYAVPLSDFLRGDISKAQKMTDWE